MIVVLDTNVFVSALLSPAGPPAEIIHHWEANEFDVVISTHLLRELEGALGYPRVVKYLKLTQEEIRTFLKNLATIATVVEPELRLAVIEKDPDDNRILECAVAGNASYIITGDKHLLEIKEYQGIVILSPAGFLTLLELEKKKSRK